MYSSLPLSLMAGQPGIIRLAAAEGQAVGELSAGILSPSGRRLLLDCSGGDVRIPPLEEGQHLIELRAAGKTVLYRHLCVYPTPLSGSASAASGEPALLAVITISSPPGPQGEDGDKGAPGRDGRDGTNGKDGKDGPDPGAVMAELEPYLPEYASSTAAGDANATALWIQLAAPPQGPLMRLALHCRSNQIAAMTLTPLYLAIWQQLDGGSWAFLGVSREAAVQAPGRPTEWAFDALRLTGRPIRLLPCASPSSSWQTGPVLGVRCSAAADGSSLHGEQGNTLSYTPQVDYHIAFVGVGQDGAPGVKGDTGPAGDPGPDGKNGTNGKDGANGRSGSGFFGMSGIPSSMRDLYEAARYAPYLKQLFSSAGMRDASVGSITFVFDSSVRIIQLPVCGPAVMDCALGRERTLFTPRGSRLSIWWSDSASVQDFSPSTYLGEASWHEFPASWSGKKSVTLWGEFALFAQESCMLPDLRLVTDIRVIGVSPLRFINALALESLAYFHEGPTYNEQLCYWTGSEGDYAPPLNLTYPLPTIFANLDRSNYGEIFRAADALAVRGEIPLCYFAAAPIPAQKYQVRLLHPELLTGNLPPLWEDPWERFSATGSPFRTAVNAKNYALAQARGWA